VTVIDCQPCGFKHQHPWPSEAEVKALYEGEYYEEVKPDYRKIVEEDADHIRLWAESKRVVCERILDGGSAAGPRAMLDIGASFGQFLAPFSDVGWRAVGVEPSHVAAGVAVEKTDALIINRMFEEISNEELGGPFHVVHMAEVINHVLDPRAVLQRIWDGLLVPGGLLVVETSNDFNPLQEAIVSLYDDVRWWIVPDHISYFDTVSLAGVIEQIGFSIEHVEATFPMELFPLMGDNYRVDAATGQVVHGKRKALELNLERSGHGEDRRRFSAALGQAGFGRSSIVYASR